MEQKSVTLRDDSVALWVVCCWVILNAIDLLTSLLAFGLGLGEANLILRLIGVGHPWGLLVYKLVFLPVPVLLAYRFSLWSRALKIATLGMVFIVLWNMISILLTGGVWN